MDFRSATIISRALVPSALFIPTLLSTVNAALSFRGTSTTRFLSTIQQNRATIQPIVHVISFAPGALQIFVVSSQLRFRLKTQLLATPLSLNSLKLRGALDAGKLDFDLPTWSVISVLAYVLIIQGPAAIRAGAITPVVTTKNSMSVYPVPLYREENVEDWGTTCRPAYDCGKVMTRTNEIGKFTNVAWKCELHVPPIFYAFVSLD